MDIGKKWIYPAITTWLHILIVMNGVSSTGQPEALYDSPEIASTQDRFNFSVGETARLHCTVENLGDKELVWKMASDPDPLTVGLMKFSEDPRLTVDHDYNKRRWTLTIRNVQFKDSGLYECQISSRVRHLRAHMTLSVTASTMEPSLDKNIKISGHEFVNEGDAIMLECTASGTVYPLEHIDWFRNGDTLTTDISQGVNITMRYSVDPRSIHSTLIIRPARLEDKGDYVCRASNKDVVEQKVHVLADPNREKEKRGTKPDYTVSGLEDAHAQSKDKNTGSRPSMNLMTSLILALVCVYLVRSDIHSLDWT